MVDWLAAHWRAVVVTAVFLGSLGTLVGSSTLALRGSGEELRERERLRAAAAELAGAAGELLPGLLVAEPDLVVPEGDNRRLAVLARRVLADYPNVEGGFYLGRSNQFAGFVPARDVPDSPALVEKSGSKGPKQGKPKKGKAKKAKAKKPPPERRDPPPLETEFIREQAREALTLPLDEPPTVGVRDVGPSRVAVAAAPVGADRPATLAVWVMVRLIGPAQQSQQLRRLRLATGLSLGGVLLAVGVSVGLLRSLRRGQRQRERLAHELRRSEHLAVLGRMLAGMAHEVRNPLAAIRSTVQLWQRLPGAARTPESLQGVIRAVDRVEGLIGRLLLFASADHMLRLPVDLNGLVQETLDSFRHQAQTQGVVLTAELEPNLPVVQGVAQALRQVVLNLTTNALQAMPDGGSLLCRTSVLSDGVLELIVSDTGPGVPQEERARLFEPFSTTRSEGMGLGLALCREIARQHGGDVTLDPTAGPGATFRFRLPQGSGPAQPV